MTAGFADPHARLAVATRQVRAHQVCTAVSTARELHVVAGGEVVERWEVAASGANW